MDRVKIVQERLKIRESKFGEDPVKKSDEERLIQKRPSPSRHRRRRTYVNDEDFSNALNQIKSNGNAAKQAEEVPSEGIHLYV